MSTIQTSGGVGVRETVTTLLDAFGLVLVAVGAGAVVAGAMLTLGRMPGFWLVAAGGGAITAGCVVVTGSAIADRRATRDDLS
jgi:hypothetical protein